MADASEEYSEKVPEEEGYKSDETERRFEFYFTRVQRLTATHQLSLGGCSLPLVIDFDEQTLAMGDMNISFCTFRYIFKSTCNQDIYLLSFMSADNHVRFIFLKADEEMDTRSLNRALSQLLEQKYNWGLFPRMSRDDFVAFSPSFHGWLDVSVAELSDACGTAKYFCVVDKECLYLQNEDENKASHCVYFWKEMGVDVLEYIKYNSAGGFISYHTQRFEYRIHSVPDDFVNVSKGVYAVSPGYYAEPSFPMTKTTAKPKQAFPRSPAASSAIASSMATASSMTTTSSMATVDPPERSYFTDSTLKRKIDEMEEATSSLRGNEAFQPMWDSAQFEMIQLQECQLVPDIDMMSGGIDENNEEHFISCLDVIKRDLTEQTYERALSHMKGCREVFKESSSPAIRRLLQRNDFELLERLFFYSYYS